MALQARLTLRQLGLFPLAAAVLWLMLCWVVEPTFLRQQGVDLTWPSISAAADLYAAGASAALLMGDPPPGALGRGARTFLARALGALLASCSLPLSAFALLVAFGIARHESLPWAAGGQAALRHLLLWGPLMLLAQVRGAAPVRIAAFAAAVLLQLSIHRVSRQQTDAMPVNFGAFLLAVVGGLALACPVRRSDPTR